MRYRKSEKSHATLQQAHGGIPCISSKIKQKHLQFAGHCFRAKNETTSSLPSDRVGSRKLTFPDT